MSPTASVFLNKSHHAPSKVQSSVGANSAQSSSYKSNNYPSKTIFKYIKKSLGLADIHSYILI